MSLSSGTVNNPAIDSLVQSSLESENEDLRLEWISYEKITNITPTQIDKVYYGSHNDVDRIILQCLGSSGSSEECTPTLVSEFARTYSLPTHKYNNGVNQFRRYHRWLRSRNILIEGFT